MKLRVQTYYQMSMWCLHKGTKVCQKKDRSALTYATIHRIIGSLSCPWSFKVSLSEGNTVINASGFLLSTIAYSTNIPTCPKSIYIIRIISCWNNFLKKDLIVWEKRFRMWYGRKKWAQRVIFASVQNKLP